MSYEDESGGNSVENASTPWDNIGKEVAFNPDVADAAAEESSAEESSNDNTAQQSENLQPDENDPLNNPRELAGRIVLLRGNKGGTWDKKQICYVDDNGMPYDWAHLTGYLRRNPDKMDQAKQLYYDLSAKNEGPRMDDKNNPQEVKYVAEAPAEEVVETAAEEPKTENEPKAENEPLFAADIEPISVTVPDSLRKEQTFSSIPLAEANSKAVELVQEPEPMEKVELVQAQEKTEEIEPQQAESEQPAPEYRHPNALGPMPEGYDRRHAGNEAASAEDEKWDSDYQSKNPSESAREEKIVGHVPEEIQTQIDQFKTELEQAIEDDEEGAYDIFESRRDRIIGHCNQYVQAIFHARRANESMQRFQQQIGEYQAKLKELPSFTLPFTKKGREKRELKRAIKDRKKMATQAEKYISSLEVTNPNPRMAEDDQRTVRAIDTLEQQMKPLEMRHKEEEIQRLMSLIDFHKQQLEKPKKERAKIADRPGEHPYAHDDDYHQSQIDSLRKQVDLMEEQVAAYMYENPDYKPKIDVSAGLDRINALRAQLNQPIIQNYA